MTAQPKPSAGALRAARKILLATIGIAAEPVVEAYARDIDEHSGARELAEALHKLLDAESREQKNAAIARAETVLRKYEDRT